MALAAAIEKIKIRQLLFSVDFLVPTFRVTIHGNEPVGLLIRERLQQHATDQAEHHRGRSNAERQCK